MEEKKESTLEEFLIFKTQKEKELLKWLLFANIFFLIATGVLILITEGIFKMGILSLRNYGVLAAGNLLITSLLFPFIVKGYKVGLFKYMIAIYGMLLIMGWMYFTDPQYNKPIFAFLPISIFALGIFFSEFKVSLFTTLTIAISYGLLLFHYSKVGLTPPLYEIYLNYTLLFMSLFLAFVIVSRIRFFLLELIEKRREAEEAKGVLEIKVKARTSELEELTKTLDEKVKERTKELQERINQLERFSKLTVGRELRMVELKERIKELEEKIKEFEKYKK